jgi:predicted P-loop ATPase
MKNDLIPLPGAAESLRRSPRKIVWLFADAADAQAIIDAGGAACSLVGSDLDALDFSPLQGRRVIFVLTDKNQSKLAFATIAVIARLSDTPMPSYALPDQWGKGGQKFSSWFRSLSSRAKKKAALSKLVEIATPTYREEILALTGRAPTNAPPVQAQMEIARPDWTDVICRNNKGRVRDTIANLILILDLHPEWQGVFGFNERSLRVKFLKTPPFDRKIKSGEYLEDHHATLATIWFQNRLEISPSPSKIMEAFVAAAHQNPFDPVRDYLKNLKWDGTDRLTKFVHRYYDAADTDYHSSVGICWMIAAVARTFDPGCKVDTAMVLWGRQQGKKKSSALRALAGDPEFFSDQPGDNLKDKDSKIALQGPWIVEHAELDGMTRSEVASVRVYFSIQEAIFRAPYGRSLGVYPRRVVFCGTVNEETFLSDAYGARRFWTVAVGDIDLDAIKRDRDQLWAEAVHRYRAGEQWWLSDEMERISADVQERHYQEDAWEEIVASHLDDSKVDYLKRGELGFDKNGVREYVTMTELFRVLDIPTDRRNTSASMRIGKILVRLGWERHRRRLSGGKRSWVYCPPDEYHDNTTREEEKQLSFDDDDPREF